MTEQVTKVGGATVTLKPSEQVVQSAAKTVTVTDSLGRVITLKKPSPLDALDFKRALGSNWQNQLYLIEVSHLQYVQSIDGDKVVIPATEGELRALYKRLGGEVNEGNEFLQQEVVKAFFASDESTLEGESALKNS